MLCPSFFPAKLLPAGQKSHPRKYSASESAWAHDSAGSVPPKSTRTAGFLRFSALPRRAASRTSVSSPPRPPSTPSAARAAATRSSGSARHGLGLAGGLLDGLGLAGVVGAVPHHDDEREDFVCRRARKRLAVGLGRVERGTEEVGLRVDGAGRTRRGFAENGERTVVEVVGRELVLIK